VAHSADAAKTLGAARLSDAKNPVTSSFSHEQVTSVTWDPTEELEALARAAFVVRGSPEGQVLEVAKSAKLTTFVRLHQKYGQLASTSTNQSPTSHSKSLPFGYSGLQVV
jgi:hypothetical protein